MVSLKENSPQPGSPGRQKRPVTLRLFAPLAKTVYVAGSFNGWNPHGYPLQAEANGEWGLQLEIEPGRYEYRFLVDGRWQRDPRAPQRVAYRFAGENSVLVVS